MNEYSIVAGYLLGFTLMLGYLVWQVRHWRKADERGRAVYEGRSDESGTIPYDQFKFQAEAAGTGAHTHLVIHCGTEHLAEAVDRVTDLMERAQKGDRHAEKELLFWERYGWKPGQRVVYSVDFNEIEDRIAELYRKGSPDGP